MNNLEELCLESELVYEWPSYKLYRDKVKLPNESTIERQFVEHPGGVAILALDEKNNVILIEQYRYAIKEKLFEIPAGKMDKIHDEEPLQAAKRELREETGFIAKKWKYLGKIYPSPGIISEVLHLFLAKKLNKTKREMDDDEFINLKLLSLEKVKEYIVDGKLMDSKLLSALAIAISKGEI